MENKFEQKTLNIKSPERLLLEKLESENNWVFHGSGIESLAQLDPRQAYDHKRDETGEVILIPDGLPAVFCSQSVDIAIFMAVLNDNNLFNGARTGFSVGDNEVLEFRATPGVLERLKDEGYGYVYVFSKEKFTPRSNIETLSYSSVIPDKVIKVTKKDLPNNIETKEF
jgi:hypothetical protein